MPDIVPVDQNAAALDIVKPRKQLAERTLAAAGMTDHRDAFSGMHRQGNIMQHVDILFVAEHHMLQDDFSFSHQSAAARPPPL